MKKQMSSKFQIQFENIMEYNKISDEGAISIGQGL